MLHQCFHIAPDDVWQNYYLYQEIETTVIKFIEFHNQPNKMTVFQEGESQKIKEKYKVEYKNSLINMKRN